ncbi:MAG: GMC family oxidoreductase [Candidatus Schekmanbacteria bacterium]|nr:GMC family oxidoreductase [Candidatus Schekmanbacteria bacterium]
MEAVAQRAFGDSTRRVFHSLMRTAIPRGTRYGFAGDYEAALENAERMVALLPPLQRRAVLGVLWGLELSSLPSAGKRFSTLAAVSPEAAMAHLHRKQRSSLRTQRHLLRLLMTIAKLAYFSLPDISRQLGFDPPAPPGDAAPDPRPARGVTDGGELTRDQRLVCDVVVVGTGAGGAVAAAELARAGLEVVMLEAGAYPDRRFFTRRPVEMMNRLYKDGGASFTLGNVPVMVPYGQGVGGTTTVNSGTCFRTPDAVLERWRQEYGLHELTEAELAPFFDEVEQFLGVAPASVALCGRVGEIIGRGAEALGYSHGPLSRNAPQCVGSGVCAFGCPEGAKLSMDLTYVPRALDAGARLLTRCRVTQLMLSGRQATGVIAAAAGGAAVTVRARALVLALGSLATPRLLRQHRRALKLSRHVGRNLTIHPAVKVLAVMDEPVRGWEAIPQGYCVDQFKNDGMMFEGASVPPEVGAIGFTDLGSDLAARMDAFERTAIFGFLVSDQPNGRVLSVRGEPFLYYRLKRREQRMLLEGLEILCKIFFAAGACEVIPPIEPLGTFHTVDETSRLRTAPIAAGDIELSAFHPLGTCRMAAGPSRGAVDGEGRVFGADDLYVADGSLFPTSLGVNPQITIMAVASRIARRLAERLGPRADFCRPPRAAEAAQE